jgi:hypothetical protein
MFPNTKKISKKAPINHRTPFAWTPNNLTAKGPGETDPEFQIRMCSIWPPIQTTGARDSRIWLGGGEEGVGVPAARPRRETRRASGEEVEDADASVAPVRTVPTATGSWPSQIGRGRPDLGLLRSGRGRPDLGLLSLGAMETMRSNAKRRRRSEWHQGGAAMALQRRGARR